MTLLAAVVGSVVVLLVSLLLVRYVRRESARSRALLQALLVEHVRVMRHELGRVTVQAPKRLLVADAPAASVVDAVAPVVAPKSAVPTAPMEPLPPMLASVVGGESEDWARDDAGEFLLERYDAHRSWNGVLAEVTLAPVLRARSGDSA